MCMICGIIVYKHGLVYDRQLMNELWDIYCWPLRGAAVILNKQFSDVY